MTAHRGGNLQNMQTAAFIGIIVVSATLALPSIMAQDAAAPTGPEGVLYFTNKIKADAATGVKSFHFGIDAPTAAAPMKAYAQTSMVAQTYQTQWDYAAPQDFTLSGKLTIQVWISCDVVAVYRPASENGANNLHAVRAVLMKGGAEIANNYHYTTIPTCSGPSSVTEIKLAIDTKDAEFSKGNILNVQVLVWTLNPPESAAKNVHFLVGSTNRPSSIKAVGLPLPPGAAAAVPTTSVVEETLEGESVAISHGFENATSDTYRFNWTTETADFDVQATANATNGTVHVRATDGSGNETLNFTLPDGGATNFTTTTVNATSGTWTIEITYSAFQGAFAFDMAPFVAAPIPSNTTAGGNDTQGDGHAQEHGDEDSGGIPGFELAALVAAAAVTFLRRRRA